jgi:RHS repeat-associated protein
MIVSYAETWCPKHASGLYTSPRSFSVRSRGPKACTSAGRLAGRVTTLAVDPVVDPNTGLIYMQARWMDPGTGQFLSVDPLVAQTGAAYNYAGDNPTGATDPTGLDSGCYDFGPVVICGGPPPPNPLPAIGQFANGVGQGFADIGNGIANGATAVWNSVFGSDDASSSSNDEGCAAPSGANGPEGPVGPDEGPGSEGSVGTEGEVPTEITGFTNHGAEQVFGRDGGVGVSDEALQDAVESEPVRQEGGDEGPTFKFVGRNATVILNRAGQVVTAWARNSGGWRNVP